MQYRRAKNPGSSYFFTPVTHNRRPILCVPENIELLRDSFKQVLVRHSSFHRHVQRSVYDLDWGSGEIMFDSVIGWE